MIPGWQDRVPPSVEHGHWAEASPAARARLKIAKIIFIFALFDFRVKRTLNGVFLSSFILRYP